MESQTVAKAIGSVLQNVFEEEIATVTMTYRQSRLSRDLLQRADLLILDVFAADRLGPRAEGIFSAERFLEAGHRVLLCSGLARADQIACPIYWDIAADDHLPERVRKLLAQPLPNSSHLDVLKKVFSSWYRKPYDGHH